jgi:hypothetical protein
MGIVIQRGEDPGNYIATNGRLERTLCTACRLSKGSNFRPESGRSGHGGSTSRRWQARAEATRVTAEGAADDRASRTRGRDQHEHRVSYLSCYWDHRLSFNGGLRRIFFA